MAVASISNLNRSALAKENIAGRARLPFEDILTAENLELQRPRNLSWNDIDTMRTDATIDASVELLKDLVLAEDFQIVAFPHEDVGKFERAHEIADFVSQSLPRNFVSVLNNLLESIYYGYTVGELVFQPTPQGLLALEAIKIKDRRAIELVVDEFWNITGVRSIRKNKIYPRAKFVIFTVRKRGEDPRGLTSLAEVFGAWRFKQEIWPAYVRFMRTCAIPTLVGVLPETARPQPRLNSDGSPVMSNGEPVIDDPSTALLNTLEAMENATVAVVSSGTEVKPIPVSDSWQLFADAMEVANKEIVLGLLRQTRATSEAQHGSKADSETGRSLLSYLVNHLRKMLTECITRDILTPLVLYNFGLEGLDLMPYIDMGETDRYDWASDARASAILGPLITDSQWDCVTTMLSLPLPLPGEERPERAKQPSPANKDVSNDLNPNQQPNDATGDSNKEIK